MRPFSAAPFPTMTLSDYKSVRNAHVDGTHSVSNRENDPGVANGARHHVKQNEMHNALTQYKRRVLELTEELESMKVQMRARARKEDMLRQDLIRTARSEIFDQKVAFTVASLPVFHDAALSRRKCWEDAQAHVKAMWLKAPLSVPTTDLRFAKCVIGPQPWWFFKKHAAGQRFAPEGYVSTELNEPAVTTLEYKHGREHYLSVERGDTMKQIRRHFTPWGSQQTPGSYVVWVVPSR